MCTLWYMYILLLYPGKRKEILRSRKCRRHYYCIILQIIIILNENKIVLVKIVLRCLDNFEIHALFANLPLLSTCYSMRIIFCSPEKFFIWNGIFHENKWPMCTMDPYRTSKVYISIILSNLCFHSSPFKNSLC